MRHLRPPILFLTGVTLLILSSLGTPTASSAQAWDPQERETDPLVLARLETFQDWKFGLMMHWGPYSQWGVVESWSICSEDEPWIRRSIRDYEEYKRQYEALKTTFLPDRFDPAGWARAAREAGMRYVVFTTKHHDGFSMWDSRQTDYRITDPGCPFSADPRADITRGIFDAFRQEGFGIGAYFSKADWHNEDYWAPEWATPDRNVNYRIARYPERWERFKAFTYRQLEELMTGYGRIDILWLDGGWVRPIETLTEESRPWAGPVPQDQDIDMPRIAAMARSHQPGLIVVDRTVHGRYENYRTPEQQVPASPPDYVWETCMTMGDQWSYRPDDRYKPVRRLVHLLVEIVSKGGNFLLNIGPSPAGDLPPEALDRLAGLGTWMSVNGEAIYASRAIPPYGEGRVRYTRSRDGTVNAIVLAAEGATAPPERITLGSLVPRPGSEVRLLGWDRPLRWSEAPTGVVVEFPGEVRAHPPCDHAWTLRFQPR